MKIVAPNKVKVKILLFAILFGILSCLAVGAGLVIKKKSAVAAVSRRFNPRTVVIDAGHGGLDAGASAADGTLEKDLNLQIALKLNETLEAMGVKTVMVRTSDVSIHDPSAKTIRQKKTSDIRNRLALIENTDSAIFVSVHQNHFSDPKYYGAQVFYSKNNPLSRVLADCVRAPLITYLQPENTRECKKSGTEIYLLYHTRVPAVMVECGFLSNVAEAARLKDEGYQRKLAFCVAVGIEDFFKASEEYPNDE